MASEPLTLESLRNIICTCDAMNGYYCGHGEILIKFEAALEENVALRAALGRAGKALLRVRYELGPWEWSLFKEVKSVLEDPLVIEAMKEG